MSKTWAGSNFRLNQKDIDCTDWVLAFEVIKGPFVYAAAAAF